MKTIFCEVFECIWCICKGTIFITVTTCMHFFYILHSWEIITYVYTTYVSISVVVDMRALEFYDRLSLPSSACDRIKQCHSVVNHFNAYDIRRSLIHNVCHIFFQGDLKYNYQLFLYFVHVTPRQTNIYIKVIAIMTLCIRWRWITTYSKRQQLRCHYVKSVCSIS